MKSKLPRSLKFAIAFQKLRPSNWDRILSGFNIVLCLAFILSLDLIILLQPAQLRHVTDKIIEATFQTKVSYSDVRLYLFSGEIEFRDLKVEGRFSSDRGPLLQADKVNIVLDLWDQLPREIRVVGGRVNLQRNPVTSGWNFEEIFKPGPTPSRQPEIFLIDIHVHVAGLSKTREIDLEVERMEVDLTQSEIVVQGEVSDPLGSFDSLSFTVKKGVKLKITTVLNKLSMNMDLKNRLPLQVKKTLSYFSPQGKVDVVLNLDVDFDSMTVDNINGLIRCYNLSMQTEMLMDKVRNVTGLIRFRGNEIEVEELHGLYQLAPIRISGRLYDFGRKAVKLRIQVDRARVTREMVANIPEPSVRGVIGYFHPEGIGSLDGRIYVTPEGPDFRLEITVHRAKGWFVEFPYRVQDIAGRLVVESRQNLLLSKNPILGTKIPKGAGGLGLSLMESTHIWAKHVPKSVIVLLNLKGHHGGGSIGIKGRVLVKDSRRVAVDLKFPAHRVRRDENLWRGFSSLEPFRFAMKTFNPQGRVDGLVHVLKQPELLTVPNTVRPRILLRPRDMSVLFDMVPLPVEKINRGELEITPEEIVLRGIQGKYKDAIITASGKVYPQKKRGDIQLEVRELPLDEKVYTIIKDLNLELYQLLKRDFQAQGKISLRLQLEVDLKTKKVRPRGKIYILNGSAVFNEHPFSRLNGEMTIDHKDLRIDYITGLRKDALTRITGRITNYENPEKRRVEATAVHRRVKLTPELVKFLPPALQPYYTKLAPRGVLKKVVVQVDFKGKESPEPEVRIDLGPVATHQPNFPALLFRQGRIHVKGELVEVRGMEGTFAGGKVSLWLHRDGSGLVARTSLVGSTLKKFTWENIPAIFARFGLPDFTPVRKSFDMEGKLDMEFTYRRTIDKKNTFQLKLSPQNLNVVFRPFPLPITWTGGFVLVDEKVKISMARLRGRYKKSPVRLYGDMLFPEKGPVKGNVTFSGKGVTWSKEVIDSLPPEMSKGVAALEPKGKFNIQTHLFLKGPKYTFNGELEMVKNDLNLGLEAKELDGVLQFMGKIEPSKPAEVEGMLRVAKGTYSKQPFAQLNGYYTYKNDVLNFPNLRGKLYKGKIRGLAQLDLKDPKRSKYKVRILWQNGDMQPLAKVNFVNMLPQDREKIRGTLESYLKVEGVIQEKNSLTGEGWVFIKDAVLADLPLFVGIFNVLSLRLPSKPVFEKAWMKFDIRDSKFHFASNDLVFQSSAVSLFGTGTIDFNLELDILFSWKVAQGLPGVGHLLELINNELFFRFEVTGPMGKPRIRVKPLSFITTLGK